LKPYRASIVGVVLGMAAAAALWTASPSPARQSASGNQPATTATPATPHTPKGKPAPSGQGGSAGAKQGQGSASSSGSAGAGSPGASGGAGPGSTLGGTPPPDMGSIDQILEGDEEVLSNNNGFTYDPGNRRDPFKSLLIAPDRPEFRGPRPEGIPGLLIDEIDLKGIIRTARGYVAQVNASNQKKSYLLKEGDQLYDGDVVSIGKNEVVFKQIVQDPTALKPFREVVKSLTPQ
jgi:hypothetical protein